ncbi:HNH endonuclease signature motif containing protein [Leifsonia flava]|nr:HNH endonuclease signature motif containing protein [Leifsonia flava]
MATSTPTRPPGTTVATGLDLILDRLDEATQARADETRAQARLWTALAELLRLARANPHLYLRTAGTGQPDAIALAEDVAAYDAGLRLRMTSGQVRHLAHRAQTLEDRMPQLHAAFTAGTTTLGHVNTALDLLIGWDDPTGVSSFDEQLADAASTLTVAAFRRRARHLKGTLYPEPAETLHARAFTTRRVSLEPVEDGMAWIHLLVAAPDAIRIIARLTGTARAVQKTTTRTDPDWRTRNQIRADLAAGWLAGDDTPTAAQVGPILLIPALTLLGEGTEPIELRGYGPIDRASAARLLTQAPAFRRVLTDPINGEKLVYDRTRYRPTTAQRDWVAIRFEDCIDPTCTRPVDDTDLDHLEEWARDHGATNSDNLYPLCDTGNRRKNLSRIRYHRQPDGTVRITTPTGYEFTTQVAPF